MAEHWTVTGQRQTTELGPDGRFRQVMEVTYRTEGGTTGHVNIPLDRYTGDYVAQQIDAIVAHVKAVENL